MGKFMARGEGKAGCIVWTLLLIFVALAAYQVVPAQVDRMKLEDYVDDLLLNPDTSRKDGNFFVKQIHRHSQHMRLPVEEKNIKVQKSPRRVTVEIEYTVVFDFIVTDYPHTFRIYMDRELFLT